MCETTTLDDFVHARAHMRRIYQEIAAHVQRAVDQLERLRQWEQLSEVAQVLAQLRPYIARTEAIDGMLGRKRMKVAFFGRTSNGKSAVINAMLHAAILPSAMGHTTSCFCQLEAASPSQAAHVVIEDGTEQLSIDSLRSLASAHSDAALPARSLLHVHWPRESCPLLRHDVVLLDTPGVDVTAQLDECLDKHCLDADVFVLVLNAEATLARVEQQFFEAVARKLSRPNVFILNNRWDAAAAHEPETQRLVREQHTQRCVQLLCEQLQVCASEQQARQRIFYVSALETLRMRQRHTGASPPQLFAPGHEQRYAEFEAFEREFAKCISQSALRTKFEQHCVGAAEMLGQVQQLLLPVLRQLQSLGSSKGAEHAQLGATCEGRQWQIVQLRQELGAKVEQLCEEAQQRSLHVLPEQLALLPQAVQEFGLPWHVQQQRMYQRALNTQLEQALDAQLQLHLSEPLQVRVQQLEREMCGHCGEALTAMAQLQLLYGPYIDCQALMANFQADLQFRFSWGLAAIWQHLHGKLLLPTAAGQDNGTAKPLNGMRAARPPAMEPCLTTEQLATLGRLLGSSLDAECAFGCLCLGTVFVRAIGCRLMLVLGSLLGGCYLFERLSWTRALQERSFKAQYTRHLLRRLRGNVQPMAAGLAQQVKQHLLHNLGELCAHLEHDQSHMSSELATLQRQIEWLTEGEQQLQQLCTCGAALAQQLEAFRLRFMQ